MSDKPKLFIGSSVEGLDVAQKLQMLLDYHCYSTIWDQGVFEPSGTTINSLISALREFDFAVFVFTPDDVTKLRKTEVVVARDNVIFEMGLFIGRIGIKRTYFLFPRNIEGFHIPSDLAGVTPLTYDPSNSNLQSALGPASTAIKDMVRSNGKIKPIEDKASKNLLWLLTSVLEHSSLHDINYDRILGILIHTFNSDLSIQSELKVTAATIFELSDNKMSLVQIGSMGDASKNRVFNLTDDSKYVVECYKTNEMVMGFNDTLSPIEDYEYIICTPVHIEKGIISTIHLRSEIKFDNKQHQPILDEIYEKNALHFKILKMIFERRNNYAKANQND